MCEKVICKNHPSPSGRFDISEFPICPEIAHIMGVEVKDLKQSQISIFDFPESTDLQLEKHMNAPEPELSPVLSYEARKAIVPLCASCVHAKKRGHWYLCQKDGPGYLVLGVAPECEIYEEIHEEPEPE